MKTVSILDALASVIFVDQPPTHCVGDEIELKYDEWSARWNTKKDKNGDDIAMYLSKSKPKEVVGGIGIPIHKKCRIFATERRSYRDNLHSGSLALVFSLTNL